MSDKAKKARAELPPCVDANSREYRQHHFVTWGDDARFARCSRCGMINGEGISNEAKYPRQRLPERPVRHHHTFEPYPFDRRYERCACGATRKIVNITARQAQLGSATC